MSLSTSSTASMMSMNKPLRRKYQYLWELLKEKKKCKIEVHPEFHARVKKAVTKEKDKDRIFKIEAGLDNIRYRLITEYDESTHIMTFKLIDGMEL